MANGRSAGGTRGRAKKEVLYNAKYFRATYNSDLEARLATLEGELLEKALRSSARAGALVLYDEIKLRADAFKEPSGKIYSAIYHWFDIKRSTPTRKTYMVGVNKRKAPHWHNVEYGHWRINVVYRDEASGKLIPTRMRLPAPKWVPAHSYLRSAWEARKGDALRAMAERARARIGELEMGEA